jgi:hypothetical protein
MKAYLFSQGSEIWEITQNAANVIPDENTTPLQVEQYNQKNRAINMLFAIFRNAEYERVCHLMTACEVWTTLAEYHEGTAQVKACLFQTHMREYENFTQKPGESVEEMFGRFQSIINKLRVNKSATDHFPTDHEQALKLLHTLDPKVWETTALAIVEGASYQTLTTAQLFSKLKASEVDK